MESDDSGNDVSSGGNDRNDDSDYDDDDDVEGNNSDSVADDDVEITPLVVLQLVKNEMRKARRHRHHGENESTKDSDVEYDHAFDHDDRSTMKRILRATRRAIRVMTNELEDAAAAADENPVETMEYENMYYNNGEGHSDDNNTTTTKYEDDVTPLDVLWLLRKEMRRARKNY